MIVQRHAQLANVKNKQIKQNQANPNSNKKHPKMYQHIFNDIFSLEMEQKKKKKKKKKKQNRCNEAEAVYVCMLEKQSQSMQSVTNLSHSFVILVYVTQEVL